MQYDALNEVSAANGFAAVGAAARLAVLRLLVRAGPEGLAIGEIRQRLQIAPSTLAHHLRHLHDAGLITQEKRGRQVLNRANYPMIRALADYLMDECCADAVTCLAPGTSTCNG